MAWKSKNFLDLPDHIRQLIYHEAGVIAGTEVVLQPRRGAPTYEQMQDSSWIAAQDCNIAPAYFAQFPPWISDQQFRVTYNLLQTCKPISTEVKSIVCSQNSLVVSMEQLEYGHRFLRSLSSRHCRDLRELYVHLHVNDNDLYRSFYGVYDWNPIPLSQARITGWQDAATHLLSNLQPDTLSLHLICDTGDSLETLDVLQPLLTTPSALRSCELRLHPKRHRSISRMAQATAIQATGLDLGSGTSDSGFEFLRLPTEIRHAILEYTDLVTPYGKVKWTARSGFHVEHSHGCHGSTCTKGRHGGCKFRFCRPENFHITGVFCCHRHSGYSSRCQCWASPRALMLVCRVMYEDALSILYSKNRIIVTPTGSPRVSIYPYDPPARLDASYFFTRHLWPGALHFLRSLELVVPLFDPDYRQDPTSPTYLNWHFAVDHMKEHANLNAFTLIVHMALPNNRASGPLTDMLRRQMAWHNDDVAAVLKPAKCLLRPLQALRRMKRFFVFLGWPGHRTQDPAQPARQTGGDLHPAVGNMEANLEKLVMGEDYESRALGKMQEKRSQWLQFPGHGTRAT